MINDITQFSKDIENAVFPDLSFYDDYDEYAAAELRNDRENVAIWLMYPQDYPIGTVAVLNSIGNGTYYVMKRDNGYWQQITPPFQSFVEDIDEVDATVLLTVIYNPHD